MLYKSYTIQLPISYQKSVLFQNEIFLSYKLLKIQKWKKVTWRTQSHLDKTINKQKPLKLKKNNTHKLKNTEVKVEVKKKDRNINCSSCFLIYILQTCFEIKMSRSLSNTCFHDEEISYYSTTWWGRLCTMMLHAIYCTEVNFALHLLSLWCLPRDLNSFIIKILRISFHKQVLVQ